MRILALSSKQIMNILRHHQFSIGGLDVGTKRIGLAVTDPTKMFVNPVRNLERKRFDRMSVESITKLSRELNECIEQHKIGFFVVGLPIYNNQLTPFCKEIIELIRQLDISNKDVSCCFWDESHSTAGARVISAKISSRRSVFLRQKDGLAASLILSGFLESMRKKIL